MYSKFFKKQKMMRTVLIASAPLVVYGIYVFGWRVLALLLCNMIVASLVEYISEKTLYKKKQISEAALVTATLYTLTLPPSVPFWISAVGVAFAIFFGKEVFGGFGKNVFNPAIVGRAFVLLNFPAYMTHFNVPANGDKLFNGLAGFAQWITPSLDTIGSSTPMPSLRYAGIFPGYTNLFFGNITGSIGEISTLLILLGGAYMIYKKVASWEMVVASFIGFFATSYILIALGFGQDVFSPIDGVLMGGFVFGSFFMVTDPISAPKQIQAKWFYGILIGALVVVIRSFTSFTGGMMFAILIAEVVTPIIDYMFQQRNKKKRLAAKAKGA